MDAIDDALNALRDARVRLFQACQRRDALLKRKPPPLTTIAEANALVEATQAEVAIARELALAAMQE